MMSRHAWRRLTLLPLMLAGGISSFSICHAADDLLVPTADSASALFLKVQITNTPKLSSMKPGDGVDGFLSNDVYSGNQKLFPAGSTVKLIVDHLEKRKRPANDHWPWIVRAFTPRHIAFPVIKNANIIVGQQDSYPLHVSLLSDNRTRNVRAQPNKNKNVRQDNMVSRENSRENSIASTWIFEADNTNAVGSALDFSSQIAGAESDSAAPESIPAGTHCKVLLITPLSASKSRAEDIVSARLLEPLFVNSRAVLPAGTLLTGKVLTQTPPRRLSRAGSLHFTFSQVTLPQGMQLPIFASIARAQVDRRSHTRIDSEGALHGERPGKAWMAINLATTAGISKEADDGVQLLIEALLSTATDASTAGTARIVSSFVSGIYIATRHGRDVVLPAFTEIEVSLERSVPLRLPLKEQVADASRALAK
jgi:hypothetical protein